MDQRRCCERVYDSGSFRDRGCEKVAKVRVDGRWYCGTHDPKKVAARRRKQEEKWAAEASVAAFERKVRDSGEAVLAAALNWYENEGDDKYWEDKLREAIAALASLREARP